MATGTQKDLLQKVKQDLKSIYLTKFNKTQGGMDKKRAACRAIHDMLKPDKLLESKFLKIDFKVGREQPATLQNQLQKAVELKTEELSRRAKQTIVKFVKYIINNKKRMYGFQSVRKALTLGNVGAEDYIRDTINELNKARQIIWETRDEFWGLVYNKRRKLEASRLHFYIKMKGRHAPRTVRGGGNDLLPVMYWKKEKKVNGQSATVWVEYTRGTDSKQKKPPSWATEYIKQKNRKKKNIEIKTFPPEDNPNDCDNAVYLLLYRFNVHKEARVQAYAGKATNGVETRWLQHVGMSKELMQCCNDLATISETLIDNLIDTLIRLGKPLLVEVVIGRLYAQHGRRGLTENDTTEHDNIALFVCNAFGKGKAGEDQMKQEEKDLTWNLELTDMMYGMNGRVG